jgi:hypothetical protein
MSPLLQRPLARDAEPSSTAYRSFKERHFFEGQAWMELRSLLEGDGGSYGISGPRGAGKTWHMLKALEVMRKRGGIALWYPSPSEYDSVAFLSTLSDTLASALVRRYGRRPFRPIGAFIQETVVVVLLVALVMPIAWPRIQDAVWSIVRPFAGIPTVELSSAALSLQRVGTSAYYYPSYSRLNGAAVGSGVLGHSLGSAATYVDRFADGLDYQRQHLELRRSSSSSKQLQKALSGDVRQLRARASHLDSAALLTRLLSALIVLGLALLLRRAVRAALPEGRLVREAGQMRERVRFALTHRTGSEMSGGPSRWGAFKRFGERQLVERPLTLSALTYDFRALAERAAGIGGHVLIAVDELDDRC